MNPRTVIILLLLFSITVFSITGCWDRRELDTLGIVQALGLDLAKDGHSISTTVVVAIPGKMKSGGGSGGGGGGEEPNLVITQEAPTIYESFNLMNTSVEREITLLQNTVLILGEELAQKGVKPWIDQLVRFREMRRNLLIFVCRGKAADVLKAKPKLEKSPAEYFSSLSTLSGRTGMFPVITINDFLIAYESLFQEPYTPVITLYKPKEAPKKEAPPGKEEGGGNEAEQAPEPEIKAVGTAVFRKDRMVGTLDIYESQIQQLLTGKFREAMLTVTDPKQKKYLVAVRLLAASPVKVHYRRRNGKDLFTVNLKLEADLLSIQSGIDYTRPALEVFLGRYMALVLQKRVDKVIHKVQRDFKSDIFGLGPKVSNSFLTTGAWEQYHWPERFPHARIDTKIKVAIRRVGVQFHPPSAQ